MDLLDFEAQGLYFDEPEVAGVKELLAIAADNYATGTAELPLLQAYFLAPESLNVLVALNRFYYYQHRLEDALCATIKALAVVREVLGFPLAWQDLSPQQVSGVPAESLTQVRLYLFTLKAVGFLNMRLLNFELSQQIFEKLVALDAKDRLGVQSLLDVLLRQVAGGQRL